MKPAADIRAKMQAKWPGATVVGRGRGHIIHRHPTDPRQFALDTQIGAIHYGPDKNLEIDTAWTPDTGAWQYKMVLADFNVFARDVLNAGTLVEYRNPTTGNGITFQPLALNWSNQDNSRQQLALPQAVTATVDPKNDARLIWADGYGSGITFEYEVQTERLRKYVVLDSPGVIPQPEPWMTGVLDLEIEFIISLQANITPYIDGQPWDKTNTVATANRIEFRDDSGEINWYLDNPMAVDANGEIIPGKYQLRKQGAAFYITVRIPKNLVDLAAFPLRIDPTITPTTQQSADDAFSDNGGNWSLAGNLFHGVATNWNPPSRSCGYRWQVTGPTNTDSITLAYVECYAPAGGSNYVPIRFSGDDVDNAGVFVNTQTPETSFTRTTANTSWYVNGSYIGDIYNRPGDPANQQVTEVVGEIIARAGWASGNYLRLMAEGFGGTANYQAIQFDSYDQNSTNSPRLHIEYTVTGTIIEESITLGRTERCAEPATIPGVDESISTNRVMAATSANQLDADGQATTTNYLAVSAASGIIGGAAATIAKSAAASADSTINTNDIASLQRTMAASMVSGITFEDAANIGSSLGIQTASETAFGGAIVLGASLGSSASSGIIGQNSVLIERFEASASASNVVALDAMLLNRVLAVLTNAGPGTTAEAITLNAVRASVAASDVIANDFVVVAIFEGIDAQPDAEAIEESVAIGSIRTMLGGDGATVLNAVTLGEGRAITNANDLAADGQVTIASAFDVAGVSGIQANEAMSIAIVGAVSVGSGTVLEDSAILEILLDAAFGTGHKMVPTRFYVLGPGSTSTTAAAGRRTFILPPREG